MRIGWLAATAIVLTSMYARCGVQSRPEPGKATIVVSFDSSGGSLGFLASVYAQEVTTGKTNWRPFGPGEYGLVIPPPSPPIVFTVDAPGKYVVYAELLNTSETYHLGVVDCPPKVICPLIRLKAIEASQGGMYGVQISGGPTAWRVPVLTPNALVPDPWTK